MEQIYQFVSEGNLTVFIAVLFTFLSVFSLLYPLLNKIEARDRYTRIITEQRRSLFEKARQEDQKKLDDEPVESSGHALATLFRLQKLSGAKQARQLLIQAGYRRPKALLYYLMARLVLPTSFMLLAFLFVQNIDRPIADGIKLMIIFGVAVFGYFLPYILVKNNAQKRQDEIQITFPDALDMMLICVQGGISIESAINRIAVRTAEYSPILAEELGLLSAELAMLSDRKAAYRGFSDRVGSPSARTFVNAMLQAEQYGSSVSQAMRVIAEELRDMRMATAENKAAALPPKLTVPMILFFLPSLFVVILGPAIIQASRTFN
jgi:tight adherence protein C